MNDQEIIRLYLTRSESAIDETEKAYGSRLLGIARRILQNHEDAEEVKSDTYLSAWRAIPPLMPKHFFAWLARVLRNHAFDRLEQKKTRKRSAELLSLSGELEEGIPDVMTSSAFSGIELTALLDAFLRKQPLLQRREFIRRYFFMDSIAEIAEKYGVGEEKVKTDLFRLRKRLKEDLARSGIYPS